MVARLPKVKLSYGDRIKLLWKNKEQYSCLVCYSYHVHTCKWFYPNNILQRRHTISVVLLTEMLPLFSHSGGTVS